MVMGTVGHNELLDACYLGLSLMIEGSTKQWINTLPPNSVEC
jgi:hypothetical protein